MRLEDGRLDDAGGEKLDDAERGQPDDVLAYAERDFLKFPSEFK